MLRSRLKAPLAMLRRAWMSLWAPLSFLMRLPRYVHSSSSPMIVIRDAVGALTNITLLFFWLMCRPVCIAKLLSRLDFFWRWLWVVDMTARSLTKSRSSKHENRVHWIPRGRSDVVLGIIQSITTRNKVGERMQPCLTRDLTGNDSVRVFSTTTLHLKCS